MIHLTRLRASLVGLIFVAFGLGPGLVPSAEQLSNEKSIPRRGGNPLAAKITNPIPNDEASVAAGKASFGRLCVRCHGPSGKGDGGGAGAGGQPADLTDATWEFGSSDGEIFNVLQEGTSADMEGYAERISETEMWNLVNFIRSIGPSQK